MVLGRFLVQLSWLPPGNHDTLLDSVFTRVIIDKTQTLRSQAASQSAQGRLILNFGPVLVTSVKVSGISINLQKDCVDMMSLDIALKRPANLAGGEENNAHQAAEGLRHLPLRERSLIQSGPISHGRAQNDRGHSRGN